MDREDRINVFLDTVKSVFQGHYTNSVGDKVYIPKEDQNGLTIENSTLYDKEIKGMWLRPRYTDDMVIEVVNDDSFYAAKKLIDEGYIPAVLNMASAMRPGGGVTNGSAAQEEDLCRRSNLFQALFRYDKNKAKDFGLTIDEKQYPMDWNYGCVYTPAVAVIKNGSDKKYSYLDKPFMVDIISVAAIKNPTIENGKFTKPVENVLKNKIRTILNAGVFWENDSLVLGAFGCGAFKTPPELMAELFKEVLSEENYRKRFRKIVFAILDDGNSHKEHNPNGNLKPFENAFKDFKVC